MHIVASEDVQQWMGARGTPQRYLSVCRAGVHAASFVRNVTLRTEMRSHFNLSELDVCFVVFELISFFRLLFSYF